MEYRDMQKNILGLIKQGPKADSPELDLEELQSQHLGHLKKMHDEGLLLLAGPLTGNEELRGLLIFNTDSVEPAKQRADQDPAVLAGRLEIEYLTFMAPPGTKLHMGAIPS